MSLELARAFFGKSELGLEDLIVYVLAKVYNKTDWRRVARGRDPLDVFQHRVLAAAYMPNFRQFLSKLCLGLGIQGLRIESHVLDVLDRNSQRVLDELRHATHFYVAKAYELAIYMRQRRTGQGGACNEGTQRE